jgi:hypothetical protein
MSEQGPSIAQGGGKRGGWGRVQESGTLGHNKSTLLMITPIGVLLKLLMITPIGVLLKVSEETPHLPRTISD